jgi:predicted AAA+ superfamily ATPase
MDTYLPRLLEKDILRTLKNNPIVGIIGARQTGKSSIARKICKDAAKCLYLDLQIDKDLNKIQDNIEVFDFFEDNMDGLIVIDEVQLRPDIFQVLRPLTDRIADSLDANYRINHPGRFLVLGSASPVLLKQSSESLTGRIGYRRLATLLATEIPDFDMQKYFIRGGFPRSYLADTDDDSQYWKKSYISNFLKRDILQWGEYSGRLMEKIWATLIAYNGQESNYHRMFSSEGISSAVAKDYIYLFNELYLVDIVPLYAESTLSKISRNPKTYIIDSGLAATGLGINSFHDLKSSNNSQIYGTLWESIVLNHLRAWYPRDNGDNIFYYRNKKGYEIDFIIKHARKLIAIECKTSGKAHLSSGTHAAMEILKIPEERAFIVTPFSCDDKTRAITLPELHEKIEEIFNAPAD